MTTPVTSPLTEAHSAACFGGKAANLSRIMSAGLRTPGGFAISTQRFSEHIRRLNLSSRLESLFAQLSSGGELQELLHEAKGLRTAIQDGGLDASLRSDLSGIVKPGVKYAVRSSAPGEDGEKSSFAGQFDSVLGCTSLEEVEQALMRVWASFLSDRAMAYAAARGQTPSAMGVVIQPQIDAIASGVLFSADPRDPTSGRMIVEYCAGLGDKLVSGELNPGRGVFEQGTGCYTREISPEDDVNWQPGPELYRVAMALERTFGSPQDIEFCVDGSNEIFILQSRPITARTEPTSMVTWTNANIAENFPDPVCPMVQSFVSLGYGAYFRSLARSFGVPPSRVSARGEYFDTIVGCHGGRLYYNLTSIHNLLYAVPGGHPLAQYFNTFTGAKDLTARPAPMDNTATDYLALATMPFRIVCSYLTVNGALSGFERKVDAYAEACDPRNIKALPAKELGDLLRGFLEIRLNAWTPAALSDAGAMISYGLLGTIIRGQPNIDQNELLQGLPGMASAAPVEALWDLATKLKSDALAAAFMDDEPEVVLSKLQAGALGEAGERFYAYLHLWGFRSSGELLLIRPSPVEDPLPVLRLLRVYLESTGPGPADKSREQAKVREDKTRAAARALGPFRGLGFRAVLWATQAAIRLRERARMKQALLYVRLRHVALELGRRQALDRKLDQPEDVFFLSMDEAIALSEGQYPDPEIIVQRKQAFAEQFDWAPPDAFSLPKGQEYERDNFQAQEAANDQTHVLTGTPACGGRISGTAAVVLDVSEIGSIREDQILVTRQTDPGWAAVFFMVKGLVIERGGLLSHGAIIAREYGIPAVIGVPQATVRIKPGAIVDVLGDRGEVRIHA